MNRATFKIILDDPQIIGRSSYRKNSSEADISNSLTESRSHIVCLGVEAACRGLYRKPI